MPVYRIADINVAFEPKFLETAHWYEKYEVSADTQPEIFIEPSAGFMDYLVKEGIDITPPIAENIAIFDRFNSLLLRHNGTYIHGSALLFRGRVYIFSGKSGVGKSTLTANFIRLFPGAIVINDDKPSLRIIDEKCIVYGSPFAGGTDIQQNLSAELGAVIFLEQAEENSIVRIDTKTAITNLMEQTNKNYYEKNMGRLLDVFSKLISSYPLYKLSCNISDEAVYTALKIMKEDEYNES